MSGHVPDFIEQNAKVVVDGRLEVVKDYFFTSGDGHNSDTLVLQLKNGKEIEFDYDRVKPLEDFSKVVGQALENMRKISVSDGELFWKSIKGQEKPSAKAQLFYDEMNEKMTAQKAKPAKKSEAEIIAERLEILKKKRPPSPVLKK